MALKNAIESEDGKCYFIQRYKLEECQFGNLIMGRPGFDYPADKMLTENSLAIDSPNFKSGKNLNNTINFDINTKRLNLILDIFRSQTFRIDRCSWQMEFLVNIGEPDATFTDASFCSFLNVDEQR